MSDPALQLIPVGGLPEIESGADLPGLLAELLAGRAQAGDVLIVTHKVISKAEGRTVQLAGVEPSEQARRWAARWRKDPRQVEVVLRESAAIVRMESGVIVSRTAHGLVCANAGVDRSNSPGDSVVLLPQDPDASARAIAAACAQRLGFALPTLVSDSFGRAWRMGIVNVAIGVAGMSPFTDYRGQDDPHGYPMEASLMASADALCAAAELVMGKTAGVAAALARGFAYTPSEAGSSRQLVRPAAEDFFR